MLFRNASEIQNDRVIIFSLGGPAPCGRRRAIRSTSLRSCRSYPCRDRASGRCRHIPFGREGAGIGSRRLHYNQPQKYFSTALQKINFYVYFCTLKFYNYEERSIN